MGKSRKKNIPARLGFLLCVLFLFSLIGLPPAEASNGIGIDVSYYQGNIDWEAVKPQIDFAIIRCGYGQNRESQDDGKWYVNADACTRLGIPFGTYLYSYATTDAAAKSEAEHVLRLIQGYSLSYPVYLDLEDATIRQNCTQEEILRHARIFCETIEAAGYTVGVYANLNWWTNYLTSSEYDQWSRWVAQYNSSCSYTGAYDIWQYSSSGTLSGISGKVDMNQLHGTIPQPSPSPITQQEEVSFVVNPSNGSYFTLKFTFPGADFVDVWIRSLKTDEYVDSFQLGASDSFTFTNSNPLAWGNRFCVELRPDGSTERVHRVLYGSELNTVTFPDTQAPVIDEVQITDVSENGYTVSCRVRDNVGVSRVAFPTWTETDGQDDLIWYEAELNGETASVTVRTEDHNGEQNASYITHIYAWDAAGNEGFSAAEPVWVPAASVAFVAGDVNLDGMVTREDAELLSRWDVGLDDLSEEQLARADRNGDGMVNAGDAVLILQQTEGGDSEY